MIGFLQRYYSLGLVLALVAPLWLGGAYNSAGGFVAKFHDALIWSALLLTLWLLMTKRRGLQVKGTWRKPALRDVKLYTRLLLAVLLIDFGSKALFFRWDRPEKVELIKNFGLHSVFHETAFETFHFVLLIYFAYVFGIGGVFFRFANLVLDRVWMVCCTFTLGGGIALFGERFLFGGVHDSFYFAGPLMWICPPCASPYFSSYAWTPADMFVQAVFLAPILLIVSYFVPPRTRV